MMLYEKELGNKESPFYVFSANDTGKLYKAVDRVIRET